MSLTAEDKDWISKSFTSALTTRLDKFSTQSSEITARLEAFEVRVDAKLEKRCPTGSQTSNDPRPESQGLERAKISSIQTARYP